MHLHRFVLAIGAIIFFGFTADKFKQQFVFGNSLTGKVGATQKPDHFYDGCFCHMPDGVQQGPHNQVQAWISGPDSLRVGETAVFTLYGRKDSLRAGGFNIAAFLGTLDTLSAGMRIEDGELTHTFPKVAQGDTLMWQFRYTAPANAGRDTIYANFCAVDTSYDPNGDYWNYAPSFVVTVVPNSSAPTLSEKPSAFSLAQNYPNPFNPTTLIQYQLSQPSTVRLELFDAVGRKVATLVNARQATGVYSYTLNASQFNLSSGVYLYRLQTDNFAETKKMLFLK
ncbi:MAG: T9SS type A sorting domain-containing protein [Chloroherpetonaceae bacterium]